MKPIIRAQMLSNKCKKVKSTGLPKKNNGYWQTQHIGYLSLFLYAKCHVEGNRKDCLQGILIQQQFQAVIHETFSKIQISVWSPEFNNNQPDTIMTI